MNRFQLCVWIAFTHLIVSGCSRESAFAKDVKTAATRALDEVSFAKAHDIPDFMFRDPYGTHPAVYVSFFSGGPDAIDYQTTITGKAYYWSSRRLTPKSTHQTVSLRVGSFHDNLHLSMFYDQPTSVTAEQAKRTEEYVKREITRFLLEMTASNPTSKRR